MRAYWGIIPAAGLGERFKGPQKQYFSLHGITVLEHTAKALLANAQVQKIVIALSPDDEQFQRLPLSNDPRVITVQGGETRMQSVNNALNYLNSMASSDDWVLVHDAARPCLHPADLNNLIATVADDDVGGLLAFPVTDTIKFVSSANRISHTVSRHSLWQAMTPQLFRLQVLMDGIKRCQQTGMIATDEAQAVEQLGLKAKVVKCLHPNPKLTYLKDLEPISLLLQSTEEAVCV